MSWLQRVESKWQNSTVSSAQNVTSTANNDLGIISARDIIYDDSMIIPSRTTTLGGGIQIEPQVKQHCRVCGKEKDGYLRIPFSELCDKCSDKVLDKIIKGMIPLQKKNYCYECFSHYNACKCPKKEALGKLRR